MFILDTNVVSELRKANSGKADPNVVAWASRTPAPMIFLSVVSILEIELGILQIERRDAIQGKRLRDWLENQVISVFAENTINFDVEIARQCAALHVPDPRSERDAIIAATALVHGMTVVTRNGSDFEATGVSLLNPWELTG